MCACACVSRVLYKIWSFLLLLFYFVCVCVFVVTLHCASLICELRWGWKKTYNIPYIYIPMYARINICIQKQVYEIVFSFNFVCNLVYELYSLLCLGVLKKKTPLAIIDLIKFLMYVYVQCSTYMWLIIIIVYNHLLSYIRSTVPINFCMLRVKCF